MSDVSLEVLNIVYNIFGSDCRKHNTNKKQISFDCPVCDEGRHKSNLEINYGKLLMKCWKCGEDPDGLKGSLRKIVKTYGMKRDLQLYDSITEDFRPDFTKKGYTENYKPNIKLPKEYIHLATAKTTYQSEKALNYLLKRGLTKEDIKRWDIGYCEAGEYSGRVIIPSYDKDGDLNFFVARSYVGHKMAYKNPEIEKTEVIINHLSINWDSTIFIVEGMFDMMGLGLDNTIPLLGKVLHPKLLDALVKHAKGNIVICLDPDATRNAYKIYRQLQHIPRLYGKIRVIDIPDHVIVNDKPVNLDIAKVRELYGQRGVIKILRRARTLELQDYIEYGLL